MREGFQNRDVASASSLQGTGRPRVNGIDLFRGLLVVLVVLGHFAELTQRHHFLTWFGFGFRMPLFIGLTGYLFNLEQARAVSSIGLVRKYYGRLILPWLAACAVALTSTGMVEWFTPFYALVRPPFHLWFVPVILAFIFLARLCRLGPTAMLAVASPVSIAAMYTFGVGHDVWQVDNWMPDRRYFIYLIYFAFGMWVARQPFDMSKRYPALAVAAAGLIWWARLYYRPSPVAEVAAELLLCMPLIVLFPWLRKLSIDIPLLSAVGRDSLFFYLWHPMVFAVWAACGLTGAPLLLCTIASILAGWMAIGRLPTLSGVLGVRATVFPAITPAAKTADGISTGGAI